MPVPSTPVQTGGTWGPSSFATSITKGVTGDIAIAIVPMVNKQFITGVQLFCFVLKDLKLLDFMWTRNENIVAKTI